MTKHSTHRGWKGHCLLCAANTGKVRAFGKINRLPARDRRKLGLSSRRAGTRVLREDENGG